MKRILHILITLFVSALFIASFLLDAGQDFGLGFNFFLVILALVVINLFLLWLDDKLRRKNNPRTLEAPPPWVD